MSDIDLGFSEKTEPEWLTNRYFPCKLGGKPAWLELENLPTTEELLCINCKLPKTFLCQIYAPFEDEHNFHRIVYVFICRTKSCQKPNVATNLTVLRSQLPRINEFYSAEPPDEDGPALPAIPTKRKLCCTCGCLGPLSCSRCKESHYCSAAHQRAHWPQHKLNCTKGTTNNVDFSNILFPEYEIVIEPNTVVADEQTKEAADTEAIEKARLEEFQKLDAAGKTGTLHNVSVAELDKYAQSAENDDKHFRKFKKEVNQNPEQLLRYKRNGKPLWIADTNKTIEEQLKNIPNCENCGSSRQFEFQIMPQMLLLLKDDALDWGVLAIYTCAQSCSPTNTAKSYLNEFIIKQDIVPDAN